MPLFCYLIATIFNLKTPMAAGLIIIGCCPGGLYSNLICFFVGADVSLSIAMTSCSSALAVGVLPLNMLSCFLWWVGGIRMYFVRSTRAYMAVFV